MNELPSRPPFRPAFLSSLLLALLPAVAPGAILAHAAPGEPAPWTFRDVARVVVLGEVHGQSDHLRQLLRTAGLTNEKGAWTGGKAHLVLLGDLLGYGPDERAVLDTVLRLETEAAAAGGRVHALLGEHELAAVLGDPRRVAPESCAAFAAEEPRAVRAAGATAFAARRPSPDDPFERIFPPGWFGRRAALAPGGRYGDWLLSRPAAILIDDTLFAYGGASPALVPDGPGPLNARVASDLVALARSRAELEALGLVQPIATGLEVLDQAEAGLAARASELGPERTAHVRALIDSFGEALSSRAFAQDGPIFYSRTARAPEDEERATFDAALAAAGARRLVMGHLATPGGVVTSRFEGRAVRVSTGLPAELFRGQAMALEITPQGLRVLVPGAAEPALPRPEEPAPTSATLEARDRELEEFLLTAEVVKIEEVGVGVTKPRRVTLAKDGVTRRAVFKTIDDEINDRVRLGENNSELTFSDRYRYEIAAYRLDRMIGLFMVPVTVERTIGKERGSLQAWVERAVDEGRRLQHRLELDDQVSFRRQRDAMYVFDVLIYNTDRNLGNILYTFGDGRMHLVDHSRAFRTQRGRPRPLKGIGFDVGPALAVALRRLDRETLEPRMKGLLSREQIKAVLARRDSLLEEHAAR